jgi:nickel transport protein
MREHVRTAGRLGALAAAVVLLCQPAAYAHSMRVFADVAGRTITGNAYMSGGGNPRDAQVIVLGPGGRELGRTRTDDKGNFRFDAAVRCDHTFVIDSGDGHRAECIVRASELPADLPAPGNPIATQPQPGSPSAATSHPQTPVAPMSAPQSPGTALPGVPAYAQEPHSAPAFPSPQDPNALRAIIARTVRNEIEAHEHRTRLRDVVSGIGYAFGTWGVVMMVLRRRKLDADPRAGEAGEGAPRESRGAK